ncbi:unnamed protein product [Fusarium equiseti]|uniref:Transcription factor n=1 Tax=Fusarium equiseti TaxID=61235 RepID=A0A8J2J6B1_FUSEQ|nr:unnamed protein product [Fusarium equiseti]
MSLTNDRGLTDRPPSNAEFPDSFEKQVRDWVSEFLTGFNKATPLFEINSCNHMLDDWLSSPSPRDPIESAAVLVIIALTHTYRFKRGYQESERLLLCTQKIGANINHIVTNCSKDFTALRVILGLAFLNLYGIDTPIPTESLVGLAVTSCHKFKLHLRPETQTRELREERPMPLNIFNLRRDLAESQGLAQQLMIPVQGSSMTAEERASNIEVSDHMLRNWNATVHNEVWTQRIKNYYIQNGGSIDDPSIAKMFDSGQTIEIPEGDRNSPLIPGNWKMLVESARIRPPSLILVYVKQLTSDRRSLSALEGSIMILFTHTITTIDPSHSEVMQVDLELILEANEVFKTFIEKSMGPRYWKTFRLCLNVFSLALFHHGKLIDYQLMQESEGYIKEEPTDN